ncbi:MAG: hypothetical protein AAF192_11110 [Pseudomonadota bacterium]
MVLKTREDFDMSELGFALDKDDFSIGVRDTKTTKTRWDLEFPDGFTQSWTGSGLTYRTIRRDGGEIDTPFGGVITGGTDKSPFGTVTVSDMRVKASEFFRVSKTRSDKDNMELAEKLLRASDELRMGSGDDVALGLKGNDEIYGGGGDDLLLGGQGKDELIGGGGGDVLEGETGKDELNGGAGKDRLIGGKQNDMLKGGGGADAFVYDARKLGRDVIEDFSRQDTVEIDRSLASGFEDLRLATVKGDGAVRFAGTTVIFDGLDRDEINEGMFDFV